MEQTSQSGERMWTVGEVSTYLRMSKQRVRKWVHDRQLPAHRLPGSTRFWFDPEVVRAFARGQLSPPTADIAKSA